MVGLSSEGFTDQLMALFPTIEASWHQSGVGSSWHQVIEETVN